MEITFHISDVGMLRKVRPQLEKLAMAIAKVEDERQQSANAAAERWLERERYREMHGDLEGYDD